MVQQLRDPASVLDGIVVELLVELHETMRAVGIDDLGDHGELVGDRTV